MKPSTAREADIQRRIDTLANAIQAMDLGGNWLISHDQVSVPVDRRGGRARLDLAP